MKIKLQIKDKVLNRLVDQKWEEEFGYFLIDRHGYFAIQRDDGLEVDFHPKTLCGNIDDDFVIEKVLIEYDNGQTELL